MRLSRPVLTIALALLGSATALAEGDKGEIRIGQTLPYSGPASGFGIIGRAQEAYFEKVNAEGGINGRKIKFIVEDHGYQVPKAVQNFNKLVNSDKVFAMILNLGTPMNIAGFKMMEPAKVANVSPLTAARQMVDGDITYKYTGGSSYYDQLKAGIDYLVKQTGATKTCSMYFPSDFGLEVFEATRDKTAELGLTYAAETTHKPDDQDFVGSLTKLREAGCQIVSTAVGVRQTIVILGTAKKLGWTDVSFIGSSAGFNTAVAKVPGGITEGYYAAASWSDLENRLGSSAELKTWADGYKAKFNEDPGTAAQLGWSAANTLVKGIEAAGKDLTPESFQKGMESLEYDDPIADAHVKYGPDDHQGGDLIVISKIEGGVWKEVGRQ